MDVDEGVRGTDSERPTEKVVIVWAVHVNEWTQSRTGGLFSFSAVQYQDDQVGAADPYCKSTIAFIIHITSNAQEHHQSRSHVVRKANTNRLPRLSIGNLLPLFGADRALHRAFTRYPSYAPRRPRLVQSTRWNISTSL